MDITVDELRAEVAATTPEYEAVVERERFYAAIVDGVRAELKSLRQGRKINQTDIARKLGMTQAGVSKLETAGGDLGLTTLCRYADALGMRPTISFEPKSDLVSDPTVMKSVIDAILKTHQARVARAQSAHREQWRAVFQPVSDSAPALGAQLSEGGLEVADMNEAMSGLASMIVDAASAAASNAASRAALDVYQVVATKTPAATAERREG